MHASDHNGRLPHEASTTKTLQFIQRNPRRHWVGNGFPVRSVFSYQKRAEVFLPFLLLDHAGPTRFEPTTERRGVGQHPHSAPFSPAKRTKP